MEKDVYKLLAEQLDSLPNGFPATKDGAELRLLAKIFSPEEAELTAQLHLTLETPEKIATRIGLEPEMLRQQLKTMARRGLITTARLDDGLGYGLMPFVVGIYEMQVASMDTELAHLFEDYYQQAFGTVLKVKPQFHRVVPVGESIRNDMEIHPFESAADLVKTAQSWGVLDCICRKQKALLGDPCEHPVDVCMILSERPGAFKGSTTVQAIDLNGALTTLQRAAKAGLVHSVSNSQEGISYICNCCTCSCGILRGMSELGIADVIAHSAFINTVDETSCNGCEICLDYCQFDAISMDGVARVNRTRCVGCGVCVLSCPNEAMVLIRRPVEEVLPIPETQMDWGRQRAVERRINPAAIEKSVDINDKHYQT